jgi:hypothetical protein
MSQVCSGSAAKGDPEFLVCCVYCGSAADAELHMVWSGLASTAKNTEPSDNIHQHSTVRSLPCCSTSWKALWKIGALLIDHLTAEGSNIMEYRSIDGSGNALANSAINASNTAFLRTTPPNFADDARGLIDGPNPRAISNAVVGEGDAEAANSQ